MESQEKQRSRGFFKKTPFIGIVVLTVVIIGLLVDATRADGDGFYSDIIRLDNVATKIHQNYVEEMPSKELIDNAIQGMLQILDPHTSYFEAKQYEELRIHTEGKFGGLGIQISIRDKVLTVMTPISGTPASRAGIQSGDQIIKIDGKATTGITIDAAVNKLRGEPGTNVGITIRRKGEVKDLDYTISREVIKIKSVPYYGVLDNDIGYLYLTTFSQDAGTEVEKAVKELLKKNVKGIIFDLRFNPGGLLPQAIEVAEKYLPKKSLVVSTRGRVRGQNKEYYSASAPVMPEDMPLAILVNAASASASEIVAGAIQDWDRGIIIGDTTFGKGSVQSILPLDDKAHHLKITTAFYYTPSGRCINRAENAIRGFTASEESADSSGDEATEGDSAKVKTDSIKGKSKIDTAMYKTKSGRMVYGGGGIIPDSIIDMKKANSVIMSLFSKDVFFQFANLEYVKLKKHKAKIDKSFEVDPELMKDFYTYLDSIKFTYQSLAQIKFEDFQKRSGLKPAADSTDSLVDRIIDKPVWSKEEMDELKKSAQQMNVLLTKESKREVTQNEADIKKYVRESILERELGQDNEFVYHNRLNDDAQVKSAIEILKNKVAYASLLKPKATVQPSVNGVKISK